MAAILADDIFKCILLHENDRTSLEFDPRSPIDDKTALVQIMAWRRRYVAAKRRELDPGTILSIANGVIRSSIVSVEVLIASAINITYSSTAASTISSSLIDMGLVCYMLICSCVYIGLAAGEPIWESDTCN